MLKRKTKTKKIKETKKKEEKVNYEKKKYKEVNAFPTRFRVSY